MRCLILSCNTGEGHNSAAKAIKEYFEMRSWSCDIMDALAFWSQASSNVISKGHVFIYRRLPKLFGMGYRYEENHPAKEYDNSLMYNLSIKGCDALYELLAKQQYDAVISTHVFAAMMMTELRIRRGFKIPSYFVSTDYTCHPGTNEINADKFFIAHPSLIPDYEKSGINQKYVVPSGIPIKPAFYDIITSLHAKQMLKLPTNSRIVLLMSGSMGCGPLEELTENIALKLPDTAHLVVICGNNRKLYNALTKGDTPENITVVGFTNRVPLYMDAAELIITKPGGLSTTEAANKHLPMVFIDAVPGCETHNLNFFVSHGFAATRSDEKEIARLVCELMLHPEQLEDARLALADEFNGYACETIYKTIYKELNQHETELPQL